MVVAFPPSFAQRFQSDDPDEVRSWVTERDGHHSRVVHGTGQYGFRLDAMQGPSVKLAWGRSRLANSVRARYAQPTFHLPVHGIQRYAYGRRWFDATLGKLVFVTQGAEVTRQSEGDPVFAVVVDTGAFASELQRRHGAACDEWPRAPQVLELPKPQQHALAPRASASGRTHAEARLISALVGALRRPTEGRISTVSMQRIKLLEDWIDAHASEAITLGRLCEVARIGERSLQLAFQARHGMSPMRFVAERRLAAAHRRLASADVANDVTSIATSLGFVHLGRFAQAYRVAYGEAPSRTVARARRAIRQCSDMPSGAIGGDQ
jgi:AraC-like DNA-binding protein